MLVADSGPWINGHGEEQFVGILHLEDGLIVGDQCLGDSISYNTVVTDYGLYPG